jgi:hypothetical protein
MGKVLDMAERSEPNPAKTLLLILPIQHTCENENNANHLQIILHDSNDI